MEDKNKNLQPKYVKKDNFRFVIPYNYCYQTYVKQRWNKREILEILQKEFCLFPAQYYSDAIENEKILINGKKTQKDYKLQMNDKIEHFSVRHEPPVYNKKIEIIFEDDQLLVVDKPSSMPVHEGGAYYFNSLSKILQFENGYKECYSIHRIDRLTSGIVLFAKSKAIVEMFHEEQKQKQIEKLYLAKVSGNFSTVKGLKNHEILVETYIYCQSFKEGKYAVLCDASQSEITQKQAKLYLFQTYNAYLRGITKITFLSYNEIDDSTYLECFPITGRTHQIRVHLQHLGFPIINDICYGGRFDGNLWIKQQEGKEEEIEKIAKKVKQNEDQKEQKENEEQKEKEEEKANEQNAFFDSQGNEWQLSEHQFEICLHSYKYCFSKYKLKTTLPIWFK